MPFILRRTKGSPLTNDEVDDNFDLLNTAKESLANKGVPNGYPSLDASGRVPPSQVPGTGNIDGGDADSTYGSGSSYDGGGA